MKRYPLPLIVLLALLAAACETPTEAVSDEQSTQEIPKNARTVERLLPYAASMATLDHRGATVDFAVAEVTPAAYSVQVYFEEAGGWAQLPYTLAGDYCGDLIDLAFFYREGTVTMTITPNTVRPSTKILPPPTRIKIVTISPAEQ